MRRNSDGAVFLAFALLLFGFCFAIVLWVAGWDEKLDEKFEKESPTETTTQIQRLTPIPTLPENDIEIAKNGKKSEVLKISVPETEAETEKTTEEPTGPDLEAMNVWELAAYLYGIDELTTTRMLKLITIEDYPADWTLDYYCACACVTRALYPQNFDGSNIYERFGENDHWYGAWMDEAYGIADHAYGALRAALLNFTYVNQCNGMARPWSYIYYSEIYGIYVWNP